MTYPDDDGALDQSDLDLLAAFERQHPDGHRDPGHDYRPASMRDPLPPGPGAHPTDLRQGWGTRVQDGLSDDLDLERETDFAREDVAWLTPRKRAEHAALADWIEYGDTVSGVIDTTRRVHPSAERTARRD